MSKRKQSIGVASIGALVLWATALHGGLLQAGDASASSGGDTIEVPADHATIQEAVDAAHPGDLILVSAGVYHEAVNVQVENLTIRGLDRNEVILDGEFELDTGIRVLGAGGVAIENMTAINYTANGFFWTGVDGYRGSYLTTTRIGLYGIYAFDSINGQLDHSYASGIGDAGFYIGQCYPCNAVMSDVVAEYNGIGFSGTNAGGEIYVVNSRFNNNRVGIVPNSGSYELCYPQRNLVIAGNLVYSNNQDDTPAISDAILDMGNGILVAGGIGDTVVGNRVWDHARSGIGLVPYIEEAPVDDQPAEEEWDRTCAESKQDPANMEPPDVNLWNPLDNTVTGNVVSESGAADLVIASVDTDLSTLGNCFAGNDVHLVGSAGHRDAGAVRWRRAGRLDGRRSRPRDVDRRRPERAGAAELRGRPDARARSSGEHARRGDGPARSRRRHRDRRRRRGYRGPGRSRRVTAPRFPQAKVAENGESGLWKSLRGGLG